MPDDDTLRMRRDVDRELDALEAKIAELRILYEQYFVDVLAQPPEKLQKEVRRFIKLMLKAPFKNSASRFRLRTLINRYQTYHTYWERVLKQREEGTYVRDVFKAEMREKIEEEQTKRNSKEHRSDEGLRQLYTSYEQALRKTGSGADNLNFDSFKRSLLNKAKDLKAKHGVKKLHYKVVVKDGKVVLKASAKD
jgi:hypothetical protein